MRRADTFDMPETPRACVRCGSPYGLSRQPFRLGVRAVDLYACQACWRRYVTAGRVARLAALLCGITVAGGAALGVASGSLAPAVVGSFVGGVCFGAALGYWRWCGPRRARGAGFAVDVPGVGRVRVGE
jgi:hypothetical protein